MNRSTLTKRLPEWILLGLLTVVVYAPALDGPLYLDDIDTIREHPHLTSPDPWTSLRPTDDNPLTGRPVTTLSFVVNHRAGVALDAVGPEGVHASAFRVVNLGIHVLNVLILRALLELILRSGAWPKRVSSRARWFAAIGAAAWGLHPLCTEAVNYITQRTELLFGTFFLLTILAARRRFDSPRPVLWKALACACIALGMLSKEVMIVTPLVVVAIDLALKPAGVTRGEFLRGEAPFHALLALSLGVALLGVLGYGDRGGSVGSGEFISVAGYLWMQGEAMARYVALAVFPGTLCADYGTTDYPVSAALALLGGTWVLALCALGLRSFLRGGVAWAGVVWFLFVLAPTTSVLPILTEPIAERRMYIPLIPMLLGVLLLLDHGVRRVRREPRASAVLLVVLTALLGARTYVRSGEYADDVRLLESALIVRPGNPRAMRNLAVAHINGGRLAKARAVVDAAMRSPVPMDHTLQAELQVSLSDIAREQGDFAAEERYLERAVEILGPRAPVTWLRNLAAAHRRTGRLPEALFTVDRAISMDASDSTLVQVRAAILLQSGKFEEAAKGYRTAIGMARPGHDPANVANAYADLAECLWQLKRHDAAAEAAEQSLERSPRNERTWFRLVWCYRRGGHPEAAEEAIRRAFEALPESSFLRRNLRPGE